MPPKKKSSAKPIEGSELSMQVDLFDWAENNSHMYPELKDLHSIPNEIKLSINGKKTSFDLARWAGYWLNRSGRKKGILDIHLPHGRGGYFSWWCELKKGYTNDPTPEQIDWLSRLSAAGNYAIVARSMEEARESLIWYLSMPVTIPVQVPAEYSGGVPLSEMVKYL